jgi:hypothetical protein
MTKTNLGVALAAAVLAGTATIAMAADLTPYVGKYPFDKVGGKALYEIPELKRDFVAKFGEPAWTRLISYATAGPVEALDDDALGKLYVVWQCKPHDCTNEAVVLLNAGGNFVGACFATELAATTSVEWMAPGRRGRSDGNNCGSDAADRVAQFKQAIPPKK